MCLHKTLVADNCTPLVVENARNAAVAYNYILDVAASEWVVLVHQDVYAGPGLVQALESAVESITALTPRCGVLGVYGIDAKGEAKGFLYSTGLGRLIGVPQVNPVRVRTLDEVVLVMRRAIGLRFDENVPGFHLYGTDICLEAERWGYENYVVPVFCVHNSNGIVALPMSFWLAYAYLRRKWWSCLPIGTPCTVIDKWPVVALRQIICGIWWRLTHRKPGVRVQDPVKLWQELAKMGVTDGRDLSGHDDQSVDCAAGTP